MNVTFPLSIGKQAAPLRQAAAWFIAGADADVWLEEIASWNVPMTELSLCPMPRSLRDRSLGGVLVIVPPDMAAKVRPGIASPYGVMAGRLYLPVDARLGPGVADRELAGKLLHETLVLHPAIGLVGLGAGDKLRISDLLKAPDASDVKWDRARSGVATAPHLVAVEAEPPAPAPEILQQGREDIGSLAEPDKPTPPRGPMAAAARGVTRPLSKLLDWLANSTPSIPVTSNWLQRLGRWASARVQAIDQRLSQSRLGELQRLVEMMDSNPDRGLQYAIPLAASAQRGVAPPSSRLLAREAEFNLPRLRRASAADAWQVPWAIHQKLLLQYHAAANRELARGRFRRAAYIFAELLGDFSSAANALKRGRHYREAAALYRDNLHNPQAAAECLEEGGQLAEAAAMFETLKIWEKAGDLYARIERESDAARCWRMAAGELVQRHDYLPASRLLERKLKAADEAMDLLIAAWPAADRAAVCLAESFELAGRLGRHEFARRRVTRLVSDPQWPDRIAALAQTLSSVARAYPDRGVRAAAADATRVIAGQRLPVADRAETSALVHAVTRLADEDRLLLRDGNRFLARQLERPRPYPLARPAGKIPRLLCTFTMRRLARCFAACGRDGQFFILSNEPPSRADVEGPALIQHVIRGNLSGQFQSMQLDALDVRRICLAPKSAGVRLILLSDSGEVIDRPVSFPSSGTFAGGAVVGKPAWMPAHVNGICFCEPATAWVFTKAEPGLNAYWLPDGNLLSRRLTELPPDQDALMAAHRSTVYVSSGSSLAELNAEGMLSSLHLPAPARDLLVPPADLPTRLLVTFDEGAMLIYPGGQTQWLCDGIADPVATFNPDGSFLVIGRGGGRAFVIRDDRVECLASFPGADAPLLAAMPGEEPGQFALITATGQVRIYESNFL